MLVVVCVCCLAEQPPSSSQTAPNVATDCSHVQDAFVKLKLGQAGLVPSTKIHGNKSYNQISNVSVASKWDSGRTKSVLGILLYSVDLCTGTRCGQPLNLRSMSKLPSMANLPLIWRPIATEAQLLPSDTAGMC